MIIDVYKRQNKQYLEKKKTSIHNRENVISVLMNFERLQMKIIPLVSVLNYRSKTEYAKINKTIVKWKLLSQL